jgi:hypothetical protein
MPGATAHLKITHAETERAVDVDPVMCHAIFPIVRLISFWLLLRYRLWRMLSRWFSVLTVES